MSTLTLESRDIAGEFYELLRALDRTPPEEALAPLRTRAESLCARCQRLLENASEREEASAALAHSLHAMTRPLEELCARLRSGESARAAFSAFRAGAAPRYEAFVNRLRHARIEAPSLRPDNFARSAFHMGSAAVALTCIELLEWRWVQAIAIGFFAFAWTLEIGRRYSETVKKIGLALFGKFAHPHELVRVNSATWYSTALLPIALLFPPVACMVGVAVLGFADPAAGFVGRRWGRTRLRASRSVEGTLAFIVAGFAIAFGLLMIAHAELTIGQRLLLAGAGAVIGAIAELFSGRVDDNFSIPVTVAAACAGLLALVG